MKKILFLLSISFTLLASPFSNIKDVRKVLELSKKTDLFVEGKIVESEAYVEDTINVLNRITKAARNVVKNLEFAVYKYNGTWRGWSISSHNSSSSYYSRTGYSMVYNIKKQLYKYFWIEE